MKIAIVIAALLIVIVLATRADKARKEKAEQAAAEARWARERELAAARKSAEKNDTKETIKIVGTSFYRDEIEAVGDENENYTLTKKGIIDEGLEDERIYQYDFCPGKVELVPDPENTHDQNAIKVIVDGYQIGHIPAAKCSHVHDLLSSGRIRKVDVEIYGGNYKYYDSDEGKLEKHEQDFGAKLTLSLIP